MSKIDRHAQFSRRSAELVRAELETPKGTRIAAGEPEAGPFTLLDTFDAELARAGYLLVLTSDRLVLLGGAEVNKQPACPPGFVDAMPAGAVTGILATVVSPLRALTPVGEGKAQRHHIAVLDDEEKTMVRGELWELRIGNHPPVSFVTLQALRGYDKVLARILRQVDGDTVLDGALSAATVLRGEAFLPPKAFVPGPEHSAFEAASGIIAAHITAARRHESGIVTDIDTEFLHDYRVALRRVRSVVSLFRGVFPEEDTARFKTRFSALMARTGRLRDLDVYLLEREHYLGLVPTSRRGGIAKLFDHFAAERAAEQEKLAVWLQSRSYQQEAGRLERLFVQRSRLRRGPEADRPAPDYARRLVWKRYVKVCKLAAAIDGAPDEQVHELRIQCKKLRYLMEFFAPVIGPAEVKRLVKALKRLQNNLGVFNDCSVQQEALEAAATDPALREDADAVEIAAGIGALVTVLSQRQAEEKARVAASFAAFDSDETRAAFRALFHPGKGTQ